MKTEHLAVFLGDIERMALAEPKTVDGNPRARIASEMIHQVRLVRNTAIPEADRFIAAIRLGVALADADLVPVVLGRSRGGKQSTEVRRAKRRDLDKLVRAEVAKVRKHLSGNRVSDSVICRRVADILNGSDHLEKLSYKTVSERTVKNILKAMLEKC